MKLQVSMLGQYNVNTTPDSEYYIGLYYLAARLYLAWRVVDTSPIFLFRWASKQSADSNKSNFLFPVAYMLTWNHNIKRKSDLLAPGRSSRVLASRHVHAKGANERIACGACERVHQQWARTTPDAPYVALNIARAVSRFPHTSDVQHPIYYWNI